jgi:uncharacterized OB-fold protein
MTNEIDTSPFTHYRNHLDQGQLAYQVDGNGKAVFYPRVIAPASGATDLQWRVSKGHGTVHATTTLFPRGGEPYDVSLIDVDEGFRMMSRIEGIDPMDVAIGMRVKVRVVPGDDDNPPYPVFEPMEMDR